MRGKREQLKRITAENRILLLLYDHMDEFDKFTVSGVLSQGGMARELKMRQNNVSRALNLLITQDLVVYRTSHVRDVTRRRRVYFLSARGKEATQEIIQEIRKRYILVRKDDHSLNEWSIGRVIDDLLRGSGKRISIYQLISKHLSGNEVDMTALRAGEVPNRKLPRIQKEVDFVGREEEMELITNGIGDGDIRVISLVSMAGQGKTTLISHFLRSYVDSPTIWINVDTWMGVEGFLAELSESLHKLGENNLYSYLSYSSVPDPYTGLIKAMKDMEPGTLLVLDNIERGVPELHSFIRGLKELMIQGSGASKMVLSGRVRPPIVTKTEILTGKGVLEIELEGLDRESVKELLSRRGLPLDDLDPLYEITKGHPLAINLYLLSPGSNYREFRHSLDRFIGEEILSTLSDEERSVIHLASQFLIPMERVGFEFIEGIDRGVLDGLAHRSLLLEYPDGSFDLHDLIKESISNSIPKEEQKGYSRRAMKHHLRRGKDEDLFQFLRLARETGQDQKFLKGVLEWGQVLIDRGYLQIGEWIEDLDLEGLPGEETIDLQLLLFDAAIIKRDVDRARSALGRSTKICAGLMDSRAENWNLVMAKVLTRGAELARYEGARTEMLKRFKRSLELIRRGDHKQEEAITLERIAQAFMELKEVEISLEYLHRAESLSQNSRVRGLLSSISQKIGEIEYDRGNLSTSVGYLLRSVNEAKKDRRGEEVPRALEITGWIYRDVGEKDRAVTYLHRALAGYIEKRDLISIERVALELLSILSDSDRKLLISTVSSLMRDIEKIPFSPRINEDRKSLLLKMLTAIKAVLKGRKKEIKRSSEEYFEGLKSLSSKEDFIATLISISRSTNDIGDHQGWEPFYRAAHEIGRRYSNRRLDAIMLLHWGRSQLEDKGHALELLKRSRSISEKTGYRAAFNQAEYMISDITL